MYGNVNYIGTLPQDISETQRIQADIYGSQPTGNYPTMFTNNGQTHENFNHNSFTRFSTRLEKFENHVFDQLRQMNEKLAVLPMIQDFILNFARQNQNLSHLHKPNLSAIPQSHVVQKPSPFLHSR